MKRLTLLLAAFLASLQAVLMVPVATAATNLIANASAETASGALPQGWTNSKWGTNTATFEYVQSGGYDGAKSLKLNMTARTSGDAKWHFTQVNVLPNTDYTFSDFYKSNVTTNVTVEFQSTAGTKSYMWLGDPAAASQWTNFTKTFKTPKNAAKLTVFHIMNKVGTLETDAYSLSTGAVTPTPVPSVTPTPTPIITPTPTPVVTPTPTPSVTPTPTPVVTPTPTPGPVDPSNLIPNPSLETAAGSAPQSWISSKWGTNTTAFTYLQSGRTGGRSVKVDMTARSSGDAKWYFSPVNVTPGATYTYSNYYQSTVATEVDAMVTLTNGTVQYLYIATAPASAGWSKISGQFVAPANAKTVTFMQIIAAKGSVTTDDYSLTGYTPVGLNNAMISLTFDDAWRSIYTNGLPLLDKYGFKSTQYMLTGVTDYPDYMTIAMMQAFKAQGHEIASHTVSHPHLPTLTATKLQAELINSKTSLQNWTGASVNNFATPYGEYNASVINAIKQNYGSHRSVNTGFNTKDNFDPYNILVQNVVLTTTPAQVQSWVDKAVADKAWLVLVYHEIDTNNNEYNTKPTELDKHLQIVKNSGAPVLTIEQALAQMATQ